jgi:hypothetical protein
MLMLVSLQLVQKCPCYRWHTSVAMAIKSVNSLQHDIHTLTMPQLYSLSSISSGRESPQWEAPVVIAEKHKDFFSQQHT